MRKLCGDNPRALLTFNIINAIIIIIIIILTIFIIFTVIILIIKAIIMEKVQLISMKIKNKIKTY